MVTKSSFKFFNNPTPGYKKSLMLPDKDTIKGVMKHNSLDQLLRGNRTQNFSNIEKEYGKYGSQKYAKEETRDLMDKTFGSPQYGLDNKGTFLQRVRRSFR